LSTNGDQESIIRDDAFAAYTQALIWYFSNNNVYADRAVAILNSWAGLQGFVAGDQQDKILAAWTGALFGPAAEIMRLYPAWSANSISALQAMFRRAYYPQLNSMSTWDGNADLTQIDAMISIAVFNEDEGEFNLGLARMNTRIPAYFYLSSAGPVPNIDGDGGNINQFWYNPAQWVDGLTQETCRDFGHQVQFALGSVLHAMETAWHQGVDVYTPHQSRMVAAMELQARSFLTDSMLGLCSQYSGAPSTNRYDTWEIGYNHYHNRQGVPLPNTLTLIMTQIRPNAFRDARGWNIAYETLTHGNLTDAVALLTGSPTVAPTAVVSAVPTVVPTRRPTSSPSRTPSSSPTSMPTRAPSRKPTRTPTRNPSIPYFAHSVSCAFFSTTYTSDCTAADSECPSCSFTACPSTSILVQLNNANSNSYYQQFYIYGPAGEYVYSSFITEENRVFYTLNYDGECTSFTLVATCDYYQSCSGAYVIDGAIAEPSSEPSMIPSGPSVFPTSSNPTKTASPSPEPSIRCPFYDASNTSMATMVNCLL
jgi:hypothetical protein